MISTTTIHERLLKEKVSGEFAGVFVIHALTPFFIKYVHNLSYSFVTLTSFYKSDLSFTYLISLSSLYLVFRTVSLRAFPQSV